MIPAIRTAIVGGVAVAAVGVAIGWKVYSDREEQQRDRAERTASVDSIVQQVPALEPSRHWLESIVEVHSTADVVAGYRALRNDSFTAPLTDARVASTALWAVDGGYSVANILRDAKRLRANLGDAISVDNALRASADIAFWGSDSSVDRVEAAYREITAVTGGAHTDIMTVNALVSHAVHWDADPTSVAESFMRLSGVAERSQREDKATYVLEGLLNEYSLYGAETVSY